MAITIFAQFTAETFYERRRKVQTNFQKFLKVKIKRRGSVARTKNQILMDSVKTKPQHLRKKDKNISWVSVQLVNTHTTNVETFIKYFYNWRTWLILLYFIFLEIHSDMKGPEQPWPSQESNGNGNSNVYLLSRLPSYLYLFCVLGFRIRIFRG